jgi:hypothetical protein
MNGAAMATTIRRALLGAAMSLICVTSVHAAPLFDGIFVNDRRDELCGVARDAAGRRFVDPQRLAEAIIVEARVPIALLDRANPQHSVNGTVSPDEIVYALTVTSATAPEPFGSVPSDLKKAAKDAGDRINKLNDRLTSFLRETGDRAEGYRVLRQGRDVVRGDRSLISNAFFAVHGNIKIECIAVAADSAAPTPPAREEKPTYGQLLVEALTDPQNNLRLRGKIEDLTKPKKQLPDLDTADVSFGRNEKAHQDTLTVKGVLGYALPGPYDWRLVPYARHEKTDVTPNSKSKSDVDVLSPGMLISRAFSPKSLEQLDFDVNIAPQATIDLEQHSQTLRIKASLDPSFSVDYSERTIVWLGGFIPAGPLRFRPDLTLLGEAAYVFDKGTNEALEDARPYAGLGMTVGLKVGFRRDLPFLADTIFSVDYRHLQLVGARLANAHRLMAAGFYNFTPNVAFKIVYEDGHNIETFQDERLWKLSLGLRY